MKWKTQKLRIKWRKYQANGGYFSPESLFCPFNVFFFHFFCCLEVAQGAGVFLGRLYDKWIEFGNSFNV